MECIKIENLTFKYSGKSENALDNVTLTVDKGEFLCICGKSGCGKTTLLRHLKTIFMPTGERSGNIYFLGKSIFDMDERAEAEKIGFVEQNPENQIVTDKVWHEMAFGLESLGCRTEEIRSRVAEMASYFGIGEWFHKKTTELSGGQKQLLNLASVMVMQPELIVLDEPTGQLDPIAAHDFLQTVARINREIGTTIILCEHRPEEAIPLSDRVMVMDKGKIICLDTPINVGERLKSISHDMFLSMPTPIKIYAGVKNCYTCPITIREGRLWMDKISKDITPTPILDEPCREPLNEVAVELKQVYFRYERESSDVVKNLSLKIYKGEFFSIVGGNGAGKSTAISIMSGLLQPYSGGVFINGEKLNKIKNLYDGVIGVLPQNPQALFVKKTVYLDLLEMLSEKKLTDEEKKKQIYEVASLCQIEALLTCHPYDLSGGEQQRAALAKVLLANPKIMFLDEPTKGLDAYFKESLAGIVKSLCSYGVTIIMVTHDVEFAARYSDKAAMFFDGTVISTDPPRKFFSGKSFYTTAANRMAREQLPGAILTEDVIAALGGSTDTKKLNEKKELKFLNWDNEKPDTVKNKKITKTNIIFGILFVVLFVALVFLFKNKFKDWRDLLVQGLEILFLGGALFSLIPKKEIDVERLEEPVNSRHLSKRTLISAVIAAILIPITMFIGICYLGDRKYYFISLLMIFEIMIPFIISFEKKQPKAREIVTISTLCAIGVAGRGAFFFLPQFKPVTALVIIAGVCFGGETGFLVGAVTGFVSNMFFGQGPWTPWQMLAFGAVGFLSGIIFKKGFLRKTKESLCLFGAIATVLIFGVIMNSASVVMMGTAPGFKAIAASCIVGLPFDLIHAMSTIFFLWFGAEPMIEKLERLKTKYGITF